MHSFGTPKFLRPRWGRDHQLGMFDIIVRAFPRDHVDRDRDARVVVGAELANQLLRVGAVGLVGNLLREIVALPKDLADDADDLLGMMVVLAENQGLWYLAAAGNNSLNRLSR